MLVKYFLFCVFSILIFPKSIFAQEIDSSREVINWPTSPELYKPSQIKDSVTVLAFVNIVKLPDDLIQYKHLKRIDIFSSPKINLDKVVSQIQNLPTVVALGFAECKLKSFPEEICSLTQLKSFSLVRDTFDDVPPGLSRLVNLQFLDLGDQFSGGNNISSFHANLSSMKNLHYLYLFGNNLKKLPDGIEHLSLFEIDLNANHISDASVLFSIPTIKVINLSNNNIHEIPLALFQLKNLRELYLYGNPFSNFPETDTAVESVKYVELPKQWKEKERNAAVSIFPNAEIGYH
jgi:Leucine-rich repeat (LRR) protein